MRINYDEPESFDNDALYADVCVLAQGRAVTAKGYDYTEHRRADSDRLIDPPDVLLLEGIHMFRDARLCAMMSLKVYMHVDVDVLPAQAHPPGYPGARPRYRQHPREQYLSTVKPMNEQYIMKYIQDADFAVMRGGKNVLAIDAISAYLTAKVLAERFEKDAGKPAAPACMD